MTMPAMLNLFGWRAFFRANAANRRKGGADMQRRMIDE